jgi:hypothetical protein
MGMPIMPQRTPCKRLQSYWFVPYSTTSHSLPNSLYTDRELILVPKKGRPVTQCQHCRSERKKRSAHVSCDCGQPDKQHHPREKCIHLREAEEKAKATGTLDDQVEKDSAHLARIAEEQGCCCGHGGKCTCSLLMKEYDDPIVPHGPAVKPKLEKTSSEGSITVFQNGHHKPVHRRNHAAHECGMPYKIPMPRHQSDQSVHAAARRSVDNLSLDVNQPYQHPMFSPLNGIAFNGERRKSKSEQPSPKVPALAQSCNGVVDSRLDIDFSALSQTQTNQSMQSTMSESFGFTPLDAMSGLSDNGFDPWSAYPSSDITMPNNNPFGPWTSSNEGSHLMQPALTAASSGTTSEIDEIPPIEDTFDLSMPSIQEDSNFDFFAAQSNNSMNLNRRSLPPGMFGNIDPLSSIPAGLQSSFDNYGVTSAGKGPYQQRDKQMNTVDEAWRFQSMHPLTGLPQYNLGGLPTASRPQSRSLGPDSAPNDVLRQLFPNLDVTSTGSSGDNELQPGTMDVSKAPGMMQSSQTSSGPMDFGTGDVPSMGFTSQAWADGSLSMPNEMTPSSFNLEQDFSSPEYTSSWPQ